MNQKISILFQISHRLKIYQGTSELKTLIYLSFYLSIYLLIYLSINISNICFFSSVHCCFNCGFQANKIVTSWDWAGPNSADNWDFVILWLRGGIIIKKRGNFGLFPKKGGGAKKANKSKIQIRTFENRWGEGGQNFSKKSLNFKFWDHMGL